MIWLLRLYLLFMGLVYFLIGVWAIFDPILLSSKIETTPFLEIVGLSVASEIGYSEIAGLYGGLNLWIGIMCIVGIFLSLIHI